MPEITEISENNDSKELGFEVAEGLELPFCFYGEKIKTICIEKEESGNKLKTKALNYYVGLDWLIEEEKAVWVTPKLDKDRQLRTNILKMLFEAVKYPETKGVNFYEIKFDKPFIEIDKNSDDVLTPLLIIHYLQMLKQIVRKGLKKSYYKKEENLNSRIKGKINTSKTLKQNVFKGNLLYNHCTFEEFGENNIENRILKKAMLFCQKALLNYKNEENYAQALFNYCMPAFEKVDENISLWQLKQTKVNAFYKEYETALYLARLILKRFGYNLKNAEIREKVKVPPFWIDMAKLFELYVLGTLKDAFGSKILFQYKSKETKQKPDFLHTEKKIIIDAKYKKCYQNNEYKIEDIRQLSGYGRDVGVLNKLGVNKNTVVCCLIVYPDKVCPDKLFLHKKEKPELEKDLLVEENKISGFTKFYKKPIKLPPI